jgi:hypothetical protein
MRYVLYSALYVFAAAVLVVVLVNLRDARRKELLAYNGRRLDRVAKLLEKQRPFPLATVHDLLARQLGSDGLNDAWHRPFEIAIRQDSSGIRHYIVRSLGADGIEGPCFVAPGFPSYESDCDWIVVDGRLARENPH